MKRLCMLILVAINILLMTSVVFAENNTERWKWVHSTSQAGYYFDTKTIKIIGNTIEFWEKQLNIDGTSRMTIYVLSLSDKTMHCKGETYTYSSNGNIISQHHYSGDGIPRRIVPYGKDYYFANGICDFLKINRVQEESKWHWIFSNDKYSYYIDENNISYDNNRVYFFVKKERGCEKTPLNKFKVN